MRCWRAAVRSFYREIFAAAGGGSDREVLDALWDLVWAGEVTNDTFAPLRALRWRRPARDPRRRPARLDVTRTAGGGGSLVAGARGRRGDGAAPAPADLTAQLHAWTMALLERHGVLTREAVVAEGVPGGFSGVYPILRALEEAGRVRRGYFVEGLGAAQFALPGAVDRLRAVRDVEPAAPLVHLLAATDPASPYGAALPWPRRGDEDRRPFQRAAGAYVVVVDGVAALYLERGGTTLQTLPAADDPNVAQLALSSLSVLVADGRLKELVIARVDGVPVGQSPWRDRLLEAGFTPGYRGVVLRGAGVGAGARGEGRLGLGSPATRRRPR